jgi:hypothetical protein
MPKTFANCLFMLLSLTSHARGGGGGGGHASCGHASCGHASCGHASSSHASSSHATTTAHESMVWHTSPHTSSTVHVHIQAVPPSDTVTSEYPVCDAIVAILVGFLMFFILYCLFLT